MTRALAEFLAAAKYADLPDQAIADTNRAVLDWLGSVFAGAVEAPARMAQHVASRWGQSEEATVFAAGRGSAAAAAFANGVASHILELDDVHRGSTIHAAAPIIPAALAVAEREHTTGSAFLLAVALGYEAALRIGEAVNPSHYRYWHPTGTAATFGAAAAAGSLLKLNAAQMLDALGSAGTQAAGLWEFNADGAMSKHLHPGKAAFNGVLSADLARVGFTGASQILEGERGFLRAFSEQHNPSRITDGLGARWKVSENCFKLHSCCGHTHTAIDAALELRSAAADRIAAIEISTYGPGFEIVKENSPSTRYQAKFSMAYCVAAALADGKVGLEQFLDVHRDSIVRLLNVTTVRVDDRLTARYPSAWPARVTITLTDGTVLERSAEYPRGNPENPVSTEELEDKFFDLVEPRFGGQAARGTLYSLATLAAVPDMAAVFCDLLPS